MSAHAQTLYPPAVAGDRDTPNDSNFVSMEVYKAQEILANHQGDTDVTAATRIVQGLERGWGDNAANFDYQLDLVRLALHKSMVASDSVRKNIDPILAAGLLSYWKGQAVGPSAGGDETARAVLFVELGQALIRTAQADDPAVTAAIKEIWTTHGPHHPLAKDARMTAFLSKAVSRKDYADFWGATAAALERSLLEGSVQSNNVWLHAIDVSQTKVVILQITEEVQTAASVELGEKAVSAAMAGIDSCYSDCVRDDRCSSKRTWYGRLACRSACAALCAAQEIIDHLDNEHGLDL